MDSYYTFLTNAPNGKQIISEMKRVTKIEGTISSITTQNFYGLPGDAGIYPPSHTHYYHEYMTLKNKIDSAYIKIQPPMDYVKYGIEPNKIPCLFVNAKLENISMYPIGWAFSLSNGSTSHNDKEQYIMTYQKAELEKLMSYKQLPEFYQYVTAQEIQRYIELLEERTKVMLSEIGENSIWEWQGGAQLMMVGKKMS